MSSIVITHQKTKPYRTISLFFLSVFQLFLLGKLLSPNIGSPQFDIQYSLHRTQHLLVWRRRTPLHVLHHSDSGIAFCGQLLLCHFVTFVVAAPFDGVADLGADGFGFDDVVAAVDFCEVLALRSACAAGLVSVSLFLIEARSDKRKGKDVLRCQWRISSQCQSRDQIVGRR